MWPLTRIVVSLAGAKQNNFARPSLVQVLGPRILGGTWVSLMSKLWHYFSAGQLASLRKHLY